MVPFVMPYHAHNAFFFNLVENFAVKKAVNNVFLYGAIKSLVTGREPIMRNLYCHRFNSYQTMGGLQVGLGGGS